MKNFDLFAGVDWSGAEKPVTTKSIAVAMAERGRGAPVLFPAVRSRQAVAEWILKLALGHRRALIGMDCNFGYSSQIGTAQFGAAYDYRDLWNAVEQASAPQGNFFSGGYWQHAEHRKYFWTEGKKPDGFVMPRRLTETVCGESGYGWPESPFKLIGAKQVGKGGLAGMRLAHYLKNRLGDAVAFWPFERHTGTAAIVVTEIYPRQFLRRAGHGNAKIRTREELNKALNALQSKPYPARGECTDHDADAIVSAAGLRFLCGSGTDVPDNIANPLALDPVTASREGWIFGVGDV